MHYRQSKFYFPFDRSNGNGIYLITWITSECFKKFKEYFPNKINSRKIDRNKFLFFFQSKISSIWYLSSHSIRKCSWGFMYEFFFLFFVYDNCLQTHSGWCKVDWCFHFVYGVVKSWSVHGEGTGRDRLTDTHIHDSFLFHL